MLCCTPSDTRQNVSRCVAWAGQDLTWPCNRCVLFSVFPQPGGVVDGGPVAPPRAHHHHRKRPEHDLRPAAARRVRDRTEIRPALRTAVCLRRLCSVHRMTYSARFHRRMDKFYWSPTREVRPAAAPDACDARVIAPCPVWACRRDGPRLASQPEQRHRVRRPLSLLVVECACQSLVPSRTRSR